jgi:hypothetical protein
MLSGTLSPVEQQQISRMMDQSGFQELFNAVLDEQGGELEMEQPIEAQVFTSQKLQEFHQLTQEVEPAMAQQEAPVFTMRRPLWKRSLPYAAAIIVIAGSLVTWFSGANKKAPTQVAQQLIKKNEQPAPVEDTVQYTEYYNPKKTRLKVKLPDGSMVTLGGKSRVKYPASFVDNKRDIYLDGEAFFEVTKDPNKPFTVFTGQVHTQVLGTSFKVTALPQTPVEVSVVTGKVRVSYHNGNAVNNLATMLPGDKIVWSGDHLVKAKIDPRDVLAWKNELMIFKKQTLKNILDVFQKHYGVHITVVNKGFLTEKISLSLDEKMPLDKAMNVLAVTAGFEHSIDALTKTVIIK